MDAPARFLSQLFIMTVAALLGVAAVANADAPVVVFDLPFTVECRDVTPVRYEQSYRKKIFEAVVRISPQLQSGDEKDLKKLHYEISTEQQMPIISYAPSSQVTSDVAGGAISIQTDDHHGQLLVHYLITPAAGDGKLTADLNSSHAQYTMLAPKQILVAAGTIERGCGVYYELKPSTQDTLQKQREFACLFEVPATWRGDCITVKCTAKGIKRGFLGSSEVDSGMGTLSVGLYKQDDGEAKEMANQLARRQQLCLDHKIGPIKHNTKPKAGKGATSMPEIFGAVERAAIDRAAVEEKQARTGALAELQRLGGGDGAMKSIMSSEDDPPADPRAELLSAKDALRQLNGKL